MGLRVARSLASALALERGTSRTGLGPLRVIRDVSGGGGVRLTVGTLSWTLRPSGAGTTSRGDRRLTNINDQFSYVVRIPCETQSRVSRLGRVHCRSGPPTTDHRFPWIITRHFCLAGQRTLTLTSTDRGRIERVDLEVFDRRFGLFPDNWQLQYFRPYGGGSCADAGPDGMDNLRGSIVPARIRWIPTRCLPSTLSNPPSGR